jgi:hypothetical protein
MVIDRKNKPSEIRALLRELIEDVPVTRGGLA